MSVPVALKKSLGGSSHRQTLYGSILSPVDDTRDVNDLAPTNSMAHVTHKSLQDLEASLHEIDSHGDKHCYEARHLKIIHTAKLIRSDSMTFAL